MRSDRYMITKIETGYLLDVEDYRYSSKRFAFDTWEDLIEDIRNRPVEVIEDSDYSSEEVAKPSVSING